MPLRILAEIADKAPLTLRAEISYAVCEKLCIPVEASANCFCQRGEHRGWRALGRARHVPKPANVGDPRR